MTRESTKKYQFKKEADAFQNMQSRATTRGITNTVWPRTTLGFIDFLKEVGPYPKWMRKPSIGRKDHSKGYEPGNVFWQELIDNKSHIDPASINRISLASKKSWKNPESRARRIAANTGVKRSIKGIENMKRAQQSRRAKERNEKTYTSGYVS